MHVACDGRECVVSPKKYLLYLSLVAIFFSVGLSIYIIVFSLFVDLLTILEFLLSLYLIPIVIIFESEFFSGLMGEKIVVRVREIDG